MRLSSFISSHREDILAEWKEDARRRVPGDEDFDSNQLRDHLGELLRSVADDLATRDRESAPPADREATPRNQDSVESAAEKHGARRAEQGMTVKQMVSEFPILRSCVIRLWLRSSGETPADLEDVIRFDEALDRALTESVGEFMDRLNRSRDTFLGILSHDLRDPLATVITGGKLLLEEDLDAEETRDLVRRIVDTGERMHHLVADLLDAIRTQLGGQMPIQRRDADLAETIRRIVEEFATAHRGRSVKLSVSGDLRGQWDERRVGQAVANLVNNALRHGSPGTPVDISITGGPVVAIAIHNEGPPIPEEQRVSLFEPFRGAGDGASAANASRRPNLGLYIANAIVEGHHGRIDVDSTAERGTTFTIHLPRRTVA